MGPTAQAQKIWIEVHVRHQGGTGNSLDYANAAPPSRRLNGDWRAKARQVHFEGGR